MNSSRRLFLHALGLAGCAALALATNTASAQPRPIEVKVGATVVIPLPRQPQILGSENPAVATVEVLPSGHARVTGVSVGTTRIIGRDFGELPMVFTVNVVAP